MPDTPAPGSPEAWLETLYARMLARRAELDKYERYYDGKHRLTFATPKFRATFGRLFSAFADNWCDLVVDASVERLAIQGFRVDGQEAADESAWELWRRNYLDADSGLANLEAVKLGEAAAIIEKPGPGEDHCRVTVEHPSQVIVARANGNRRQRAAALKVWLDETGHLYATVYTPTLVTKYQSKDPVDAAGATRVEWVPRQGVTFQARHGFDVVPVVPLENAPSMLSGGKSDLAKVIPLQDAVNKLATDMIVAAEFVAMPQRYATGVEIPTDPETGEQMDDDAFLSFVGRVWTVEDTEARFGQFPAADLSNYVGAIAMLIQHLSAQTRTPPHYLVGQIVNASGDALKAAETGLVSKVRRKHVSLGPGWGEVMRLARGLPASSRVEPIWQDPESRSIAELTDAAVKRKELGIPAEALWEFIGATPEQIKRWSQAREAQLLADQALLMAGVQPGDQGLPGAIDTAPGTTAAGGPAAATDVAR